MSCFSFHEKHLNAYKYELVNLAIWSYFFFVFFFVGCVNKGHYSGSKIYNKKGTKSMLSRKINNSNSRLKNGIQKSVSLTDPECQ